MNEKDTVVMMATRTVPANDESHESFIERNLDHSIPSVPSFPMRGAIAFAGGASAFKLFGSEIPLMALPMLLMDTLTSAIIILLISGFIKLANSLLISEKQKKILETERLNAELNFLKLQINPHFLFNTLNSIYSQAHLKSEQTEYSILKFSQIMRYVLYDTSTEKIPLKKDIEYISNYIDLQKIRLSKNVTVRYNVGGDAEQLLIAPLLLITYIENAFKHGVSYTIPSEIRINIDVIGNNLLLTVSNAVASSRKTGHEGVGLINAKRRLDVLYPGRYLLDVVDNKSLYIVNLKIELDHEN
jgi:LytS/YehU family sensor histidine kinase